MAENDNRHVFIRVRFHVQDVDLPSDSTFVDENMFESLRNIISSVIVSRDEDRGPTRYGNQATIQHQYASTVPPPILINSTRLTTFGHHQALVNRVNPRYLAPGGKYDIKAYTPTFVHDTLMLPGSLANLLGKASAADMIPRMTPAILPKVRAHVHPKTQLPCLVPSENPEDYVQGMLVFGEGKLTRGLIHEHYREDAKRVKMLVEAETSVPYSHDERASRGEGCTPRRQWIPAHVWLWSSNRQDEDVQLSSEDPVPWTLENYLEGNSSPK